MLRLFAFLCLAAFAGCQSPCTIYTNGLIVWCSTSAVGIGWGEYIEVAAGGKLDRASTNDVNAVLGDGRNYFASRVAIDNSNVPNDNSNHEEAAQP